MLKGLLIFDQQRRLRRLFMKPPASVSHRIYHPITAATRFLPTRLEREPKCIIVNEFNETPQSKARVSVFHLSTEFSNLNFDSPSMYSALHDKGFDTSSCRRGRRPSLFEPLRVFVNEDVYDPLTPG